MSVDASCEYYFELSNARRVFDAIDRVSKPAPQKKRLIIELPDGSTIHSRFQHSDLVDYSGNATEEGRCKLVPNSVGVGLTIEIACEVEELGEFLDSSNFQVFRRQSDHAPVVFVPVELTFSCGQKYLHVGISSDDHDIVLSVISAEQNSLKSKIEGVYAFGGGVLSVSAFDGELEFLDAAVTGPCPDFGARSAQERLDEFVDRYRNTKI